MDELEHRSMRLAESLGLASCEDIRRVAPLTGGVASDIALVETDSKKFCVKFALEKLRVEQDWHAPVSRNAAEYAWLETVSGINPAWVPELLGRNDELGGFAMEFLTGADVRPLKSDLMENGPRTGDAAGIGFALARIHQVSTEKDFDRSPFNNQSDFVALRLDPYLLHTAKSHPALTEKLGAISSAFSTSAIALVHGDVSPKNVLASERGPIFLDAECATMGDPAFDAAFFLTHYALKALHLKAHKYSLMNEMNAFLVAYLDSAEWEPPAGLEMRICQWLAALMLSRVDGKSPVEYLSNDEKGVVRAFAIRQVEQSSICLTDFLEHWIEVSNQWEAS